MQGHNQANTIPADNCREDKFDPDLDDCKGSRYVNQIIKDQQTQEKHTLTLKDVWNITCSFSYLHATNIGGRKEQVCICVSGNRPVTKVCRFDYWKSVAAEEISQC